MSSEPGSTSSGSSETFTWVSNGFPVEKYALWFGSSPGQQDLHFSGGLPGSQTSYTVTGLPAMPPGPLYTCKGKRNYNSTSDAGQTMSR